MAGYFQEDNKVPEHWHPGLPRDLDRYPLKDTVSVGLFIVLIAQVQCFLSSVSNDRVV